MSVFDSVSQSIFPNHTFEFNALKQLLKNFSKASRKDGKNSQCRIISLALSCKSLYYGFRRKVVQEPLICHTESYLFPHQDGKFLSHHDKVLCSPNAMKRFISLVHFSNLSF